MDVKIKDGTLVSGYVTSEENSPPRMCSACKWYDNGYCGNAVVKADSKVPSDGDGNKLVAKDSCCDYFQNVSEKDIQKGQLVFLILRHGTTHLNDNNAFRGWIDVPLESEGVQQAFDAANFLRGFSIDRIVCSPLSRAVSTAIVVANTSHLDLSKSDHLLPWNVGVLAGKDKKENKDVLDYYVKHPKEEIEDGESLEDFHGRMYAIIEEYLQEVIKCGKPILFVMHTSNAVAVDGWCEEQPAGTPSKKDKCVAPGGVMGVYRDSDGKFTARVLFGEELDSEY